MVLFHHRREKWVKTMAMTAGLWSISALAVEFGLDRRTVAARMRDVAPAGRIGAHAAWRLRDVAPILVRDAALARDRDVTVARSWRDTLLPIDESRDMTRRRPAIDGATLPTGSGGARTISNSRSG
jgi:hypothetical protein